LGWLVLLQDPEPDTEAWATFNDAPCGTIQEKTSNTGSLDGVGDVQVVDERSPSRIRVEYNMDEADWAMLLLREHGEVVALMSIHAFGPDGQPVTIKVAIEVAIRVRASVVATPTVCVKLRDVRCVGGSGYSYLDVRSYGHDRSLIEGRGPEVKGFCCRLTTLGRTCIIPPRRPSNT
jgi:hypothetical protein